MRVGKRGIGAVVLLGAICLSLGLRVQAAWFVRDSGTTANLWGGTGDGAQIVVVGEQGTILTTPDHGVTWTRQQSGTTAWLLAATYSSTLKRYFVVGEGGLILSSTDAVTWTREISPTSARLNGVTDSFGTIYAVGESGAGLLRRDATGVWSQYDVGFGGRWMRGVNTAVRPCVVGQGGALFQQTDDGATPLPGAGWQQIPLPVSTDLEAITAGGAAGLPTGSGLSQVAVGTNGAIFQSDREGWTARSSGTTEHLRGVYWQTGAILTVVTLTVRVTIGEYFAVGTNGTMLRSYDGVAWLADEVPTRRNLNAVFAGVIAVGDGGTILQADAKPPVITKQPTTSVGADGQIYAEASVSPAGAVTYLWLQRAGNLQPVGHDGPRQSLARAPFAVMGGVFQLYAGNAFGLAQSDVFTPNRFLDLSARANVGAGDNTLIGGFSIKGIESRTVLVRAVGPTLGAFSVTNTLKAPLLTVFSGQQVIAANRGWGTNGDLDGIRSAANSVGAFPLPAGSADSALLLNLSPGNYTAQVSSADGTEGVALVEIYDAAIPARSHLFNLSARAQVQEGAGLLIGGLVVEGGVKKNVLLRASGPSLTGFGVGRVLAKPKLTLFRGSTVVATSLAWGSAENPSAISAAAKTVGAFAFPEGSADSAMLLSLEAGNYTLQVTGADGGTGVALVEAYELP